jgi:CRP-like cAMP-binding protein
MDLHVLRLRARHHIGDEEEKLIRSLVLENRVHPRGTVLVKRGEYLNCSTLLLDGIIGRYKDLRNGKRQISELHVPGDFADLHSYTLKRLDHDVMALTRCEVAMVPHEHIQAMTEAHPRLGRIFWFLTTLDAAINREWELSLGQRSALARLAHLFCEMNVRLGLVGLTDGKTVPFSLTQTELSECVGLTVVHVNRCLRELRIRGMATFRDGSLVIEDLSALMALAEFNPDYLYLDGGFTAQESGLPEGTYS